MSLRLGGLAILLVIACGSPQQMDANEPQTAKEKQLRDAKAHGEIGKPIAKAAGWRYQGDRKAGFFVVGRKCFKTENAACQAARCKVPKKCGTQGAGPATMMCR